MGLAQNSMTHCTMKLQVWDLSSYRASFLALGSMEMLPSSLSRTGVTSVKSLIDSSKILTD
jgi:hypothetical protein